MVTSIRAVGGGLALSSNRKDDDKKKQKSGERIARGFEEIG